MMKKPLNFNKQALLRLNAWLIVVTVLVVAAIIKLQPLGIRLSFEAQFTIIAALFALVQVRWWVFKKWGWISVYEIAVVNFLARTDSRERSFRSWLLKTIAALIDKVGNEFFNKTIESGQNFCRDRNVAKKLCLVAAIACVPLAVLSIVLFHHDIRGVLYPLGYGLTMSMFFHLAENAEASANNAKQGDKNENRIRVLLKEFVDNGGSLFPRTDINSGDLDIFLKLPSGQNFAISVKSSIHEKCKYFFDRDTRTLRHSKPRGGKKHFRTNPIHEIRGQVESLLAYQSDRFAVPIIMIVVCCYPIKVAVYDDSPYEVVKGQRFLQIDEVFVVEEKDLVALVKLLKQKSKPEILH